MTIRKKGRMIRGKSSKLYSRKERNMEDEYICIDNFHKHFGAAPNIPSPGAFYGVPNLLFVYFTAIWSSFMVIIFILEVL